MGGSRMSGPHGACFRRRAIADCEHEVELRFTGLGELIPRLRAIAGRIVAQVLEEADRVRVNLALWLAAGAVGVEMSRAHLVQDRFSDDRARRISGAKEQHIIGTISHQPVPVSCSMMARSKMCCSRSASPLG